MELNRIDLQHKEQKAESKRTQQKLRDKEEKVKKTSREDIVNKREYLIFSYDVNFFKFTLLPAYNLSGSSITSSNFSLSFLVPTHTSLNNLTFNGR